MTNFSNKCAALATLSIAMVLAGGCGGRANESAESDTDADGNATIPLPTCTEICRHVVDSCVPGGEIKQCATDCEAMRAEFMGCEALGPLLRCMPKAPVLCLRKIEINGCQEERDAVNACRPPP